VELEGMVADAEALGDSLVGRASASSATTAKMGGPAGSAASRRNGEGPRGPRCPERPEVRSRLVLVVASGDVSLSGLEAGSEKGVDGVQLFFLG
jgi:hypothetical protein